ncbi:hypothetical protein [Streptomyces sp. SP17KL33]|uniref:hypothetical protein n=1 Tax=Streptomyces sp. SP17KL33 TaxID=3002534 RepID=UPI002E797EF2|nr:hypothetical protein [Streptomyces sp. SP17KL33]MEE1836201.1 hypothetical protein [Streptomyces sp. SP17KL33]
MTDRLVLVGHGMVGHTLLTALDARGAAAVRPLARAGARTAGNRRGACTALINEL